MSLHTMPLNVGDFLRDTQELSDAEGGAYIFLLIALWGSKEGRLANKPTVLRRIARCGPKKWESTWAALAPFLEVSDEWITHKRVTLERQKVAEKVANARAAGKKGGEANAMNYRGMSEANASANALANRKRTLKLSKPKTNSPIGEGEPMGSPNQKKEDLFSEPAGFRGRCKQAAGACLKPRTAKFQLVIDLLAQGWTEAEIITSIGDIADGKAEGTVGSWKYFAVALASQRAERKAKPTASASRPGAEEPMPAEQGRIEAKWSVIRSSTGEVIARVDRHTGEFRDPHFLPFEGEPPPEVAAAMSQPRAA